MALASVNVSPPPLKPSHPVAFNNEPWKPTVAPMFRGLWICTPGCVRCPFQTALIWVFQTLREFVGNIKQPNLFSMLFSRGFCWCQQEICRFLSKIASRFGLGSFRPRYWLTLSEVCSFSELPRKVLWGMVGGRCWWRDHKRVLFGF